MEAPRVCGADNTTVGEAKGGSELQLAKMHGGTGSMVLVEVLVVAFINVSPSTGPASDFF